jgi:hypothetical protein
LNIYDKTSSSLSKLNKSNNVSSGIMKASRVPVFALKSPTIAECIFESFDNAINSFSISSNDSELEYFEPSGGT